jgi:nitroimidazol reductase NimA-like FMN-containing flavoprotein (pyridoxamine 5'-phosphate oxidase superfamily)
MSIQMRNSAIQEFLQGRYIASFGTENADGRIHLTAVWYLFEDGRFFVATSSKSRKVRNAAVRPMASIMFDARTPGTERGVTAVGKVEVISGARAAEINLRVHSRYMSLAAISDPQIGPVFASFDDVTLRLIPDSWTTSFWREAGRNAGISFATRLIQWSPISGHRRKFRTR